MKESAGVPAFFSCVSRSFLQVSWAAEAEADERWLLLCRSPISRSTVPQGTWATRLQASHAFRRDTAKGRQGVQLMVQTYRRVKHTWGKEAYSVVYHEWK